MKDTITRELSEEQETRKRTSMEITGPPATTGVSECRREPSREAIPVPIPCTPTIVIHGQDGNRQRIQRYLRSSGIVYRALRLLEEWKFLPARISSAQVPVDIIALRRDVALLIQVISSKKPIPDARTLVRLYAGKINALREMGTSAQFRKILMAYSTLCGWKYYDVLPGGLIPAWDLPAVPAP